MKLGFVGVGAMGAPMARRLLGAGHDLIVFDTDADRLRAVCADGARPAADPASAGVDAEVVFVSLPSAAALEAAVLDPDAGVISAMRPGAVLVDLSTNSPALARSVAEASARRQIRCIDAPVSSVSGSAELGQLTMMVGGEPDDVAAVREVLDTLATAIFHLGPHGSGTVGKLLTQYLALTNMMAGFEAMTMAAKSGVDLATMLDLVGRSNGDSFMFRVVRQTALERDFGEPGRVNGLTQIMNKDLTFALGLAEELKSPHTVGGAAGAVFAEAMAQGFGPYHFSRVVEILESLAGTQIRA